jgi:hypothetical protein
MQRRSAVQLLCSSVKVILAQAGAGMVRRCHTREPGGGVRTKRVMQGLVAVALMLLNKD